MHVCRNAHVLQVPSGMRFLLRERDQFLARFPDKLAAIQAASQQLEGPSHCIYAFTLKERGLGAGFYVGHTTGLGTYIEASGN